MLKTRTDAGGVGSETPPAYGTLPVYLWPLMELESTKADRCEVCGRVSPLNQHHIVFRSAGRLYRDGKELRKPTITLCGFGNNLKGPDGYWCHGMAHHHRLHFRNNGGVRDCVLFGKRAESLASKLTKGLKVAVEGRLHYSSWEGKDGSKRSALEVYVDDLEYFQPPKSDELYSEDIPF